MCSTDPLPVWTPRVPKSKIHRLYQTDAKGIYDDELIDDVGYSLLARCESFIAANEAVAGKARCPRCASVIRHGGHKDELLRCPCGWELTWGEYFQTIQHKQLSGAQPVIRLFSDFVNGFPAARMAREKMLLIDRLLHGFHWFFKDNSPTRPVAINLIEGRLKDVISFLDRLTYSRQSTPGTREAFKEWNENIKTARGWYRAAEERQARLSTRCDN